MLSSTQTSNVKYDVPEYSTIVLLENDTAKNTTVTDNSTLSSIESWDRHPIIRTTAERAAIIFTDPIEALTVIVCILGIIANVASIIAIIKMRKKMTTHLKLIISLCLSDALISLGNFSYYFTYICFNGHDCIKTVVRLTPDVAIFATLLNLLVMALDHYGAIIKPLRYRQKMTFVKGNFAVVMVWLVSLFMGLAEVVFAIGQGGSICTAITEGNYNIEVAIILFIFIVLVAICLLYGRIYSRIKRAMPRRERARHHSDSGSFKALMTTGLFVGTFILFWTPFAVYTVFMYIKNRTDRMYIFLNIDNVTQILNILYLVLLLNAVFDPFIYAIRLPKVKQRFKAFFTSSKRSSRSSKTDKISTHFQQL
ncbi:adrenocorticotropic hormone receptor-like [Ruditapes philippinarum]|uniref:adrenocorticotropic hormone receptor-like n=1 Tax=Ruditapes philippinarum TaxID=129788 RepID=UPI00295ADD3E|nr:adrenocorticotropic hormone receptor-like [Ruditapes philippinarum]